MNRSKKLTVLMGVMLFLASSSLLASYQGEPNVQQKTVLTNCTVIDCTGRPPMEDVTVVIVGNKIAEIEQGSYKKSAEEKNTKVFDLDGGSCYRPGRTECGLAAREFQVRQLR